MKCGKSGCKKQVTKRSSQLRRCCKHLDICSQCSHKVIVVKGIQISRCKLHYDQRQSSSLKPRITPLESARKEIEELKTEMREMKKKMEKIEKVVSNSLVDEETEDEEMDIELQNEEEQYYKYFFVADFIVHPFGISPSALSPFFQFSHAAFLSQVEYAHIYNFENKIYISFNCRLDSYPLQNKQILSGAKQSIANFLFIPSP